MHQLKTDFQTTARVNLSPMIDMVFILLIFFVVAAVFVEEDGFEVFRPRPDVSTREAKEGPLSFRIDTSNRVFMEERQVSLDSIQSKVAQQLAAHDELAVFVETMPNANAGLMVKVLDQIRLGGVEVISLSLDNR